MADVEHSRPGRIGGAGSGGAVPGRIGAARAGLWLIAAALAVRQFLAVQLQPPGERLTDLETWIGPDGVLQVSRSLYDTGHFTGTPFAGLVLKPLAASAENALGLAWTFGTLLLVVLLGVAAAHALPRPVSRRTALLAAPVAICLLMVSLPVRNTLYLGQISVIPVLLVLLGCCTVRDERTRGLLIGLAAALEPTVLLFTPLLWRTGRRTAVLSTGVTFTVCTALAWAALPADSWTYWLHHIGGVGLGASPDSLGNQSLHGALLRLGFRGPLEVVLYLVFSAAVVAIALPRAVRYARDGQQLLAVAVTGCVAIAVSPTTWQHQLLWVLLALAGRVGTRSADRGVWPVVVILVMTLPAAILVPNQQILFPLRDNAVLLAALAAACAVPFLPRTSASFRAPVPTTFAPFSHSRLRRVPLVPPWPWRHALTRPNLVLELLLIRVAYSGYQYVRIAAAGGRSAAERHGTQIHAIEGALGIGWEHWANHAVVRVSWLRGFFDFYYESFHFVVPLAVLGVLYARRPVDFRWARSALGFATVTALLGFWLFPLAPPRLMPGLGFIDTVHGAQDFSKPDYGVLTALTNQYAAMPSLHFGWALWCGMVIAVLAPRRWMKALGMLHPLLTLCAIIVTGNHWVLDAVGGALVVCGGFALHHVLVGPRPVADVAGTGTGTGSGKAADEPVGRSSPTPRGAPGHADVTRVRKPSAPERPTPPPR